MANHRLRSNKLYVALSAMLVTSIVDVAAAMTCAQRPAYAVVGRPVTPGSYAGVARRTSRRTTRRTVARHSAYSSTAYVTALPAGCVPAGAAYACGSVTYRSYYDGPNLVYVRE
jgi:hypothetical protein